MLTKPSILTGEVKEFIDALKFTCIKSSGYGEAFDIDRWFDIYKSELEPFYSQPLTSAEDIRFCFEQYFKGWEAIPDNSGCTPCTFRKDNIECKFLSGGFTIYVTERKRRRIASMVEPQTLNLLISNLRQSGIKPEWE
jgi:hypothetical protein